MSRNCNNPDCHCENCQCGDNCQCGKNGKECCCGEKCHGEQKCEGNKNSSCKEKKEHKCCCHNK